MELSESQPNKPPKTEALQLKHVDIAEAEDAPIKQEKWLTQTEQPKRKVRVLNIDQKLPYTCLMIPTPHSNILKDFPLEEIKGKQFVLPLESVNTEVTIRESVALIKIKQQFVNPLVATDAEDQKGSAIEVVYKFPKIDDTVVSKLLISIGDDRVIEAKVMEAKKAEEKYDDAQAAGHGAVLMKQENKNQYNINIGNILPGQHATVEIHILQPLKIVGGSYQFDFPLQYIPTFSDDESPCDFNFKFALSSSQKILSVCHPKKCIVKNQTSNNVVIEMSGNNFQSQFQSGLDSNLIIMYRTANMEEPRLMYQEFKSDDKDLVTVMAQFLPTFEEKQPQDDVAQGIDFLDDPENLDELEMDDKFEQQFNSDQLNFYFVVDRSGSMNYPSSSKMDTTKQALGLFMMSLPAGCKYQIISFGSNHQFMNQNQTLIDYNDENSKYAQVQIKNFNADFGGTNIYNPLADIFMMCMSTPGKHRIFLLTDGQVGDKNQVINIIKGQMKEKAYDFKLFTFGVGNDVDKDLVQQCAVAGKGKAYFSADAQLDKLRSMVVDALQKATEPVLEECCLEVKIQDKNKLQNEVDPDTLFNANQIYRLGDIFRNQLTQKFFVLRKENFDDQQFALIFSSANDPKTKQPIRVEYTRKDFANFDQVTQQFESTQGNFKLNKIAAHQRLENEYKQFNNNQQKVNCSLKYQVLCDKTAFFGQIKRKKGEKFEDGEIIKIEQKALNSNKNPSSSLSLHEQLYQKQQQMRQSQNSSMNLKRIQKQSMKQGQQQMMQSQMQFSQKRDMAPQNESRRQSNVQQLNAAISMRMCSMNQKQNRSSSSSSSSDEDDDSSDDAGMAPKRSMKQQSKIPPPQFNLSIQNAAQQMPPQALPQMRGVPQSMLSMMRPPPMQSLTNGPSQPPGGAFMRGPPPMGGPPAMMKQAPKMSGPPPVGAPMRGPPPPGGALMRGPPPPGGASMTGPPPRGGARMRGPPPRGGARMRGPPPMMSQAPMMPQSMMSSPPQAPAGAPMMQPPMMDSMMAHTIQPQNLFQKPYSSFNAATDMQSFLANCTTNGFWAKESSSQILQFLSPSSKPEVNKILDSGFEFEGDKIETNTEFIQYILTMIAIQVLSKKFIDKQDEWKMIQQKAKKYCKNYSKQHVQKKVLEQLDKQLKNISFE